MPFLHITERYKGGHSIDHIRSCDKVIIHSEDARVYIYDKGYMFADAVLRLETDASYEDLEIMLVRYKSDSGAVIEEWTLIKGDSNEQQKGRLRTVCIEAQEALDIMDRAARGEEGSGDFNRLEEIREHLSLILEEAND